MIVLCSLRHSQVSRGSSVSCGAPIYQMRWVVGATQFRKPLRGEFEEVRAEFETASITRNARERQLLRERARACGVGPQKNFGYPNQKLGTKEADLCHQPQALSPIELVVAIRSYPAGARRNYSGKRHTLTQLQSSPQVLLAGLPVEKLSCENSRSKWPRPNFDSLGEYGSNLRDSPRQSNPDVTRPTCSLHSTSPDFSACDRDTYR
jgi:hypothetical protein